MKRVLCMLLTACMLCSLAACGGKADQPAEDTAATTATTAEEVTTTTATTTATDATDITTVDTTTGTKAPTTTKKPVTTTTADEDDGWHGWEPPIPPETYPDTPATTTKPQPRKAIHILAVGNSFSVDAMEVHLYWMLEAAGYNDIVLGNLYIGGCDLKTHYNNVKNGTKAYEFRVTTDGFWSTQYNVSADAAFSYTDWDVVTLQQASPDSGKPASYACLTELAQLVREKAKPKQLLWHMTWAYQQNSDHWAFAQYGKDQMTMYQAIVDTMTDKVLSNSLIDGVIPCGTAVQNMRTSSLGDTLTADGYHLENFLGDYLASLTWYAVITGEPIANMGHRPGYVDDHFADMVKSVQNAIQNPAEVTPCK